MPAGGMVVAVGTLAGDVVRRALGTRVTPAQAASSCGSFASVMVTSASRTLTTLRGIVSQVNGAGGAPFGMARAIIGVPGAVMGVPGAVMECPVR